MKVIIAGSRHLWFNDEAITKIMVDAGLTFQISEVVSGTAMGIDTSGEQWAKKYAVPIKKFKPDWDRYKKAAGPIRNRQMADYADALLLIWDGKSRGSASMKSFMEAQNKPVYEYICSVDH